MLTITDLSALCLAQAYATRDYPFGPETAVFRIGGKIFALLGEDEPPPHLILKCDPDWAIALREIHAAITPGYHMNKRHWNSIKVDGSIADEEIDELIAHAYTLVWRSLGKHARSALSGELP